MSIKTEIGFLKRSLLSSLRGVFSTQQRISLPKTPEVILSRLDSTFNLKLDIIPNQRAFLLDRISHTSIEIPLFLDKLHKVVEIDPIKISRLNSVLKIADLEMVRVGDQYRLKELESKGEASHLMNTFFTREVVTPEGIRLNAGSEESIFRVIYFSKGKDDVLAQNISNWRSNLEIINNFTRETEEMGKEGKKFKPGILTLKNFDEKTKGIRLSLEGIGRKQIGFNWAEGDITLERKKARSDIFLLFKDSKGNIREFKWAKIGFIEIKQEWKNSLEKINSIVKETGDMGSGLKEFKPETLTLNNPDKKQKRIRLPLEGAVKKNVSFNWPERDIVLERKRIGLDILLSFKDSKGNIREFKWIKNGFIEIKQELSVSEQEWKNNLEIINNFAEETKEMGKGEKKFKTDIIIFKNPDNKPKRIRLSIEGIGRKQIFFSWQEGDVLLERKKVGLDIFLIFKDSKDNIREFKWIKNGLIEIDKELSSTEEKWQLTLKAINSFKKETEEMGRRKLFFKPDILTFDNPDNEIKGIRLLFEGIGRKRVSFSWAEGDITLERKKARSDIFLLFKDSKGKIREFKWVKNGFVEIKQEWQLNLKAINRFTEEIEEIGRGKIEFKPDKITFNNPNNKVKCVYLPIEGIGKKQIGFSWAKGDIVLERKRVGLDILLSFKDCKGNIREFKWVKSGFIEIRQNEFADEANSDYLHLLKILQDSREEDKKDSGQKKDEIKQVELEIK